MPQLDVVEQIYVRDLHHVLEEIFGYLDFDNIQKSELVSLTWQKAIQAGRIWKQLYQYQTEHNTEWNRFKEALIGNTKIRDLLHDEGSITHIHRRICYLTKEKIESLYLNWRNFNHQHTTIKMGQEPSESLGFENYGFFSDPQFTANYIICKKSRPRDSGNKLLFYNRWTFELVKMLTAPVEEINWMGRGTIVFDRFVVNENVLVATLFKWEMFRTFPRIFVWNVNTFGLLHRIDANELHNVSYGSSISVTDRHTCDRCQQNRFSNKGNILTTCIVKRNFDVGKIVFTSRWLPDGCDNKGQVLLLYQKRIPFLDNDLFRTIYSRVFKNYIIVHRYANNDNFIKIRRICTFEIVNTIKVPGNDFDFDCRNGLLVTVSLERSIRIIRIWDIVSGKCLNQLPIKVDLRDIRFVSDQFIFGLTRKGKGLLLDLPNAINKLTCEGLGTYSKLWVKKMIRERKSFSARMMCTVVYVDEFQIVMKEFNLHERYFTAITFNTLVENEPRECPCVLANKPKIYRLYHLVTQRLKYIRNNYFAGSETYHLLLKKRSKT